VGAVRAARRGHKQQTEAGSPLAVEPIVQSPAAADRARADLAAALAEIAALLLATSDSIADVAAELAARNHSPPQSSPGLATTPDLDSRLAYSVTDAARVLSVSRSTVNKLIRLKLLKAIKLLGKRLIPRAAIEDLLKGNEQ
jgi:excisionase family DNA binding protein